MTLAPTAKQLSIIYVSLSAFRRYPGQDEYLNCLLPAATSNLQLPTSSCNHFVACQIVVCHISAHQMKFIDELLDSLSKLRPPSKKRNAQSCTTTSATLAISAAVMRPRLPVCPTACVAFDFSFKLDCLAACMLLADKRKPNDDGNKAELRSEEWSI